MAEACLGACAEGRGGHVSGLKQIVVAKGEQQCGQASPSQGFVLARAVLNRTASLVNMLCKRARFDPLTDWPPTLKPV